MKSKPNRFLLKRPRINILKKSPYHSANHTHFYGVRWKVSNAYGGSSLKTRARAGKFIYDNTERN